MPILIRYLRNMALLLAAALVRLHIDKSHPVYPLVKSPGNHTRASAAHRIFDANLALDLNTDWAQGSTSYSLTLPVRD